MTGVQVITASQVQSIGYRWQAIRGQTLTKKKAMGMKGVVSKGERQRVKERHGPCCSLFIVFRFVLQGFPLY